MSDTFNEYQPREVHVARGLGYWHDIKKCIDAGLENTRECLAKHDIELGRTTRKNLAYAEMMEAEIALMKKTLDALPDLVK